MSVIDAYAHVSLPRFMTAEDCLAVMDAHGVAQALLSTAETCPDIAELHRAIGAYPDRFRAIGLPVGEDRGFADAVAKQMAAGFIGMRLHTSHVQDRTEVLAPIGEAGGLAVMVGPSGLKPAASTLVAFLARYPKAAVIGAHFAGGGSSELLQRDAGVRELFSHERFCVVCSRHGGYEQSMLRDWAGALVDVVGWKRLLFGSEWPVALWRDETYASTMQWMRQFEPSDAAYSAFVGGNARRVIFDRPVGEHRELDPGLVAKAKARQAPVWLFPNSTVDLEEADHYRLMKAYVAAGGEGAMRYSAFVAEVLGKGLATVERDGSGGAAG